MHELVTVDIRPELKKNILNFGYNVNFNYKGMLSHSFDRFYVVAKFEIPKIEDLKLTTFTFKLMCENSNNPKSFIHCYLKHCKKIALYVKFYQKQIAYYNHTTYDNLEKEIGHIWWYSIKHNRISF